MNATKCINKNQCDNTSFVRQVAVICHEMIHYYDALYGQYKKFQQISYIQHKVKNEHLTPVFKQKKRQVRTMGIPVVSSFTDPQRDNLSDEEFMDVVMQIDESTLTSKPFSELESTENVKIGKNALNSYRKVRFKLKIHG